MASPHDSQPTMIPGRRCEHCHRPDGLKNAASQLLVCQQCGWIYPDLRARDFPNQATDFSRVDLPESPFDSGQIIRERYRIGRILGAGAQGITYAAEHQFLSQPCAVKVLTATRGLVQRGDSEQLRAEAAAGFRISHPNVVRVLDCDVVDECWFFVTELIDGCDLGRLLNAQVTLASEQAAGLLLEAAAGLQAIHAAGILHRDLKPTNLLLGRDGHLRISDFGVAAALDRAAPATAGATGTLAYAAPEVVRAGHPPEPTSDLYGLGVSFYHLLTHQLPRGPSVFRTLISEDAAPEWPESAAAVPAWLRAVILKLMDPQPDQRPASAAELVATLVEHLGQPAPADIVTTTATAAPTESKLTPVGVVVLPFECTTADPSQAWLGQALSVHLGRALATRGKTFVAATEPFQATVARVQSRFPADQVAQYREAGRLSGAAFVLAGQFTQDGVELKIDLSVYHSLGAEADQSRSFAGPLAQLADLEEELYYFAAGALGAEKPADSGLAALDRSPELEAAFFSAKQAYSRGDYEAAMQRAQTLHADASDDGEILGFMGVCCARMGRYDEAADYHQQQHTLAVANNDVRQQVEAHANLGSMYYFRGEFPAADRWLSQAAESAEAYGLESELALIWNNLGFVRLQLGKLESAEEVYQAAIRTHRKHGALTQLIGPYNGIGHVLRVRERYDEARAYFRRALSLSQESSDQVNMGVAYMNLGHCALLLGQLADAKHELAIALNVLEYSTFWNGLARVYDYLVQLNSRLENWTEAVRCAEQRIALAQRHGNAKIEEDARQQLEAVLEGLEIASDK